MGDEDKNPNCVKVAIRMRPLSKKELGNNESSIVELEESSPDSPGQVIINDPDEKEKPAQFAFDIVFDTGTEQTNVFEQVGRPALRQTLTGYNGTIFAYGQTGSGKSWSMMGGPEELRGIIPRVNEQIFVHIDEAVAEVSTRRFLVTCSFFEIYNEIIFDLLNPSQDRSKLGAGLQVKEHPVLGIYVKDLQEMVVSDAEKLTNMMEQGTKNRAVSSTLMNSVSSRSHSIFTIKVHQKDEEDKSKNVFAKLNLVDLAGSERQKGTGASGQTLKEGANINKSLSALGNVINALVENANGKKIFVPFRNSKLTRVLQESLGGNSLCTMLAALSPAACNYEETVGTLRYANRAKAIKVSAQKNEEASQISRLNAEIEELKKKLASGGGGGGGGGGGPVADEERNEVRAKYEQQLSEMQKMVESTWEEKANLSKRHEEQVRMALEEHKRQAKAMQEECRKRFRILQDQNDLTLTIRSLGDTVQTLPASKVEGGGACKPLRSGDVPREWLKTVASVAEVAETMKQQHTMALVFHGAFSEDLRLWVEGEEAADFGMARTGARRALTKVETLRRECEKLRALEQQGRTLAQDFVSKAKEAYQAWSASGQTDMLEELRESEGVEGIETPGEAAENQATKTLPPIYSQTVEDIGRILQLIEQQAEARALDFNSLGALEVGFVSELVLRGAALVPGAEPAAADATMLSSLTAGPSPPTSSVGGAEGGGAGDGAAALPPRKERPIHEWSAEDTDDTVEGSEWVLSQLIQLDGLNKKRTPQELLARPPPKFVHDVALLLSQATGFPNSVSEEWPEDRDAKIDLLQHIADSAARGLGLQAINFDPADVLKGKEVPKTLQLLQMLTIAAAKHRNQPGGAAPSAKVHRDKKKQEGLKASDMVPVLEALGRCMQGVLDVQAKRADPKQDSGNASPTRELEISLRDLQERLEEEMQLRKRQEERLAQLQQEMQAESLKLQEQTTLLDDRQRAAVDADARTAELRKQVEVLRQGLLARAQELESNPEVARMRKQLEEVAADNKAKSEKKLAFEGDVKRLQQLQIETDTNRESMELEVKRMKQRMAEDGAPALQQSEDILLLQAEKQKLDVKVGTLEEKLRTLAEGDDLERQRETTVLEDKALHSGRHDDVQMQLQVIIEERDGLRDGMDMLWQEKTRADEELENVSNGYTHLSDRLYEKIEESREVEEQLAQYENLLKMLQENFEKNRHSPATPAMQTSPAAAPAKGDKSKGGGEDDAGSSHYSDDDFEEPDED